MSALRPSAKVGIVFAGFVVAFAIAWLAVEVRQRATQGPDAQAASGMYAAGDAMLGVAVFGVVALVPIALALYWLRPVARFWSALVVGAVVVQLTGWTALAATILAIHSQSMWIFWALVRIGLMPLIALTLVTCALFAPKPQHRALLVATGIADGLLFAGVVFVKFLWPRFGGG